jgi:hypothetical protein
MTLSFGTFQDALLLGASHLVGLAAAAEVSIHTMRADNPLLNQVLGMLEIDYPAIVAIEGVAETILRSAQTTVAALQAAAAAIPAAAPAVAKAALS